LYVRYFWGDKQYVDGQLVANDVGLSKTQYELSYTRFFLLGSRLLRFDGAAGYDRISVDSIGAESQGIPDPVVMLGVFLVNNPDHRFSVGFTQAFSPAWGHYESGKEVVNVGQNRWRTKSELGMSKWFGSLCTELIGSILWYGDNRDYGDTTLSQDALFGFETHLSYNLTPRQHLALSYLHTFGGESFRDGAPYTGELNAHAVETTVSSMVKKRHQLRLFYRQELSRENGLSQHLAGMRLVHVF